MNMPMPMTRGILATVEHPKLLFFYSLYPDLLPLSLVASLSMIDTGRRSEGSMPPNHLAMKNHPGTITSFSISQLDHMRLMGTETQRTKRRGWL